MTCCPECEDDISKCECPTLSEGIIKASRPYPFGDYLSDISDKAEESDED